MDEKLKVRKYFGKDLCAAVSIMPINAVMLLSFTRCKASLFE